VSIEIVPVEGLPEIHPGDDLVSLLGPILSRAGIRDGDVVVVTQKIVSKAEGRLVPGDRETWVARESRRIVARRGDLVIAQTRHGFVCANAGVDASNVEGGFLALLPEDPDRSAEVLRKGLSDATGRELAVVVTDTFGRPWRRGLVNVAIGCAGVPALVDLRGSTDHTGRELEATVVALADEIAAASGIVMGKAARVPVAIAHGLATEAAPGAATDIVRDPEEDMFRESPLLSISSRRTIRAFGPGGVPREVIEQAAAAACSAPAPHHTRPWRFEVLESGAAKRRLLGAMAEAWRRDLEGDSTPDAVIRRRLQRSDAVIGAAPVLVIPSIRLQGAHRYPDERRATAERDMFVLSAGAGIQNLLLALHAQGFASCWISSTLFCRQETRSALGLDEEWLPMGAVAAGRPPDAEAPPRPPLDLAEHLRYL
jgi:coenzyme F420-0:L-glutamate ligase/coenzyme F420-1:gamma-L-glutamate ligase